ncbi:MAG: TIGR01244 family phosphatase [Defluviimonas sp.]|nr:TIGR01244 family phosphatase [Defluviimonas sp.]
MDIRQIVPGFAAAPQLAPEEMAEAAAAGFRTVICNRPDGEQPGQPDAAGMEAAARAVGMAFRYLPVFPGAFPDDLVAGMQDALAECEAPILAYCRSGTRSTMLWALAEADKRPVAEILEAGSRAGYDLQPLLPALRARG